MITYDIRQGTAWLTIDDEPRRNAMSNADMAALADAIESASNDPEVRVVVITGAGERAFSAGGDLSGGFVDDPIPGHRDREALASVVRHIRSSPKPVVARVNGAALGGGFGVAVACDITIAVDDAALGTPEIDLGLWPMMISAVLMRAMPSKALLDMMLTGRTITGAQAEAYGLVTRSVRRSDLDSEVDATVAALQSKSPATLALGKSAFMAAADMDLGTALDHLHVGLTATALTEDAAEGVSAFLAGREPEWRGR